MTPSPRSTGFLIVAACVLAGCFPPDEGRDPPLDRLYYPVGLVVSPNATRLYVANSDFDLAFNAGTLQVYDLERIRALVPDFDSADPCGPLGEKTPAQRLLAPGRCAFVDLNSPPDGQGPLRVEAVEIGAFVTDLLYRDRPTSAADGPDGRLFMPVRGDATLHWADVDDDPETALEVDCGQGGRLRCDDNHRRGDDPGEENTRDVRLPPEPFGIAADDRGRAVLVTHQVDGQIALFVNDWGTGPGGGPRLEFVLSGLPSGALGIASVPEPRIVAEAEKPGGMAPLPHEPGFLVTFRNTAQLRLVRFFDDEAAAPERPFVQDTAARAITALSQGFDSRGIAVDGSARARCEAECGFGQEPSAEREECLTACAPVPLDVFVSNRTPPSLLVGQTVPNNSATSSDDLPRFHEAPVPVSVGASRVVVGDVLGPDGQPVSRVFVICFDSQRIYVYDPRANRVESVIETGRGPHALALDSENGLGFISHFTDSYIGVVDLNQAHAATYGEIVLTLGRPTPPESSQ